MRRFQDKVVLVTGASMGIGEAIARAYATEGALVALAARSLEKLKVIAATIPSQTLVIQADMTQPEQVRAMVRAAVERFGRLDILVNNAGVGMYASAAEMRPENFEKLVATNWLGPVHAMQAAIEQMRKQGGGQIINISSVAGKVPLPWMAAYCSTKFALNAFSDCLRMELAPEKIHVLVVCPGRVNTPFTRNAYKDSATSPLLPGGISPERVARATLNASARNRREIVVPADNRVLAWIHQLVPATLDRAMDWFLRPRMRKV